MFFNKLSNFFQQFLDLNSNFQVVYLHLLFVPPLILLTFKSSSTFQIERFLVTPSVWKLYRMIVYLSVMLC